MDAPAPRRWRWAAPVCMVLLAGTLIGRATRDGDLSYLEVLSVGLGIMAFVGACALAVRDGFAARAAAVLVATCAAAGILLGTTVGSPGEPAHPAQSMDWAVLALATAVIVITLRASRRI
ncbi:hypothetical protein OO014_19100 [Intrasporangium calvum]|uniref:Uncharacterized protein n=1 Tax=Intrasporangium calvum TaxID=53358 RepID=A0ABT5GMF4_9MICO|nr:hypothetical protein [Intrasporangium calvum]MDC5699362.1 hypothetical protein [Intrasporangium calvum]